MAFKSKLDYTKLKSVLSVLNLRAPFTYQNLQITDVLLDAESKNLFFTTQHGSSNALTVSISEAAALSLSKGGIADAATIAEVYVSAFNAAKTETLSIAESAALASELSKNETVNLTDSPAFTTGKPFSDTFSVSENSVLTTNLNIANAFTLDDTASASDDLQTDTNLIKNNVVSINEVFANAFTLATIANNVSVSESINIQLISGANSVFNASPLNTYTINS